MQTTLPDKARVVIIGGGVIGCSVAYHLTALGWRDVLLLERKQLTSGTTWHAAGLIAQLRATRNMTRLARYSQELYGQLEAETGVATGFRRCGSITVALTDERMEELRRSASMARAYEVEIEAIGADEIKRRYPHLRTDDVVGGVWLPRDGQADPGNIALALAKGARQRGAAIHEGVRVDAVHTCPGADGKPRVSGVGYRDQAGEPGRIEAEYVVNCAGMWGREVGRMAGVDVPLQACEHFYVVTEAISGLEQLPVLRVPDECTYYKEDAGKLLVGAFELEAKPWGLDGIPEDFCFDQLPEDLEHFEPILNAAMRRMPVLEHTGIRTFFNGPESFTPDDRYLLGEAPGLRNFYIAAGFNSVGIQSAGGAGMALASWMEQGEPPFDLSDVDIRRMQPFQNNPRYLRERAREALGLLYADHFPYRQYATARGVRRSPLHDSLERAGACFGEVAGWERANWFLDDTARGRGERPEYRYSWQRQNWFEHSRAEHLAVREAVGLFDMSSFGKITLAGADACDLLQHLGTADMDVAPGRIVYTQWLNVRAGIEADLTVARLAEDRYLVVTAASALQRDLAWLQRAMPSDARCVALDTTSAEAVLMIAGPDARRLLAAISNEDVSNAALPFGHLKHLDLGMATGRAHRVGYVGELCFELYVPSEMAVHVYQCLLEAAAASDTPSLVHCGLHALDSLRLEKGFRHIGHDISDEDHLLEAGLGFTARIDKRQSRFGHFIGRDALLERRAQGLSRRLLQFKLRDPTPLLYHTEPILRDGTIAGYVSSGAYGHHLGGAVALGYVRCDPDESSASLLASRYAIEVAGDEQAAGASLQPLYDPTGLRMRG
ncbi:MAG: FAD-dependent oxidoreductase [Gammaproteobacteria bacterium]|nr:FAD-dependent oxidoreductase [Gammaproteobacteria bacterium]